MAIILYGKEPAMEIKNQVKEKIIEEKLSPELWVFTIGDDPASEVYLKGKEKDCEYCGIKFHHTKLESNPENKFDTEFFKYCDIDSCNGMYNPNNEMYYNMAKILQLPIPKIYNSDEIIHNLGYLDADGFSDANIISLYRNTSYGMRPCTAEGVIRLLKYYNIDLAGKNITIIGRSKIVGKPLSMMLSDEDATVTLCHSKTKNLKEHTINADIIISAVGHIGLITPDMINTDSILVDVGINRTSDGKLIGDIDPECYAKCAAFTPVPGGIGLMTRAILIENVYKIALMAKNGVINFMNPFIIPRQYGKSLTNVFNQILQNRLNNIPTPTHDTLYEESENSFIRDNLYEEYEVPFYKDRSYGDLPFDIENRFETSGESISNIMQKWITAISDPFSKYNLT